MSDADTSDLLARFDSLVQKYVPLAAKLAEELERFGKYKKELEAIVVELKKRGAAPKKHENLSKIIEEEIEKREPLKDDETSNSEQRLPES